MANRSKYKAEYCQQLIQHCAVGGTLEGFAGKININNDTLHDWVKKHKDFAEAKKIARAKSHLYYTQLCHDIAVGKPLAASSFKDTDTKYGMPNTTMAIWLTKNILGWRDRVAFTDDDDVEDMEFVDEKEK